MDYSVITMLVGFIAMLGGIWKIARDLRSDLEKNVSLIFRRFDQHKDKVDEKLMLQSKIFGDTYMRQDNCNLIQKLNVQALENLRKSLDSLTERIDKLLNNKSNEKNTLRE